QLDRTWRERYRGAPRNSVRDYVCLAELDDADLAELRGAEDVQLAPRHPGHKAIPRYLDVSPALMKLLGFFLAEGSGGPGAGIRFAIGARNERLREEMASA